ncbi:MAG: VanW family protein [Chloroflexota bacterium]|nr:VanW family protein [Chloroflexota bacterium]
MELLLFSVCVSLVLSLLGLVLYEGYYLRRIYPGVRALSIPLGGLTPSQAVVALPQEVNPYLERPLRLSYGDRVWVVDAAQVGVRFDRPAMARLAYGAGRGHGLRVDLWQQLAIFEAGYEVSYQLAWDQDTADRFLADLAGQINRPARDATLELRGLRVITTPSQVGWKLDVTASRERIFSQLADLAGGEVELVVREVPPELPEVGQAPQGVRRILSGPITLRLPQNAIESASSGPWVISPDLLASALHIERIEGSSRDKLAVHLKADLLRSQIELLAEELALPSVDARLGYDPDRGTFTELTPSRLGQRLDVEAALERVLAAAEGERREVLLPLTPLRPTVTAANARDLGIRELVAEGITSFEGSSQDRIQNIATAASCFHGVVVRSGEVFSFNEHLGEVSAEEGYEESLIIVGDRTRMGIGGGVCQVATTAFRAAFWGGYPIEERWAHGYRVRVYEPPIGLDATVYAPDVDFKFRNDTPYYLLIQTEVDRQTKTVAFRFYSTSVGRRVEMEEPIVENRVPHEPPIIEEDPTLPAGTRKQVDWAVDGLDVTVIRRVYEGQRLVHEDRFFSRYEPWQARFLVGTKPAG